MRFAGLVLLGFLFSLPAMAQIGDTTNPTSNGARNFGRIQCSQHFECPDPVTALTQISAYVGAANTCITQYFGYSSSSGFFDQAAGLNGSYCLSYIPGTIPPGAGTPLAPSCCLTKLSDGTCTFMCELNSTH